MHEDSDENALSDADLIGAARGGDDAAAEALFRRHRDAARRFARRLTDEARADDLVSEAFTRVLVVLRRGGGPELALRPYLIATIRNAHVSRIRAEQRIVWVDDHADVAPDPGTGDETVERIESDLLAHAFRSLPDRWQSVLWHTAVEGEDHETVGRLLDLAPNAVGALAFRAREGLRRAYLEAHLATATDEACLKVRSQLAGYVRGTGGNRQRRAVEAHLAGCPACTAAILEAQSLNERLGAVLAPALLGAGYAGQHLSDIGVSGAEPADRPHRHRGRGRRALAAAVVLAALVGAGAWALAAGDPQTGAGDASRAQPGSPSIQREPAGPGTAEATLPTATPRPEVSPSAPTDPDPSGPTPTAPTSAPPPPQSTPTGGPEPTWTPDPTSGPDPGPDPSDDVPDGWTRDDLRLVQGYQSDFEAHRHVQMRPESPFESTFVRLRVPHLVGWALHAEKGYRSATCVDDAADDGTTGILCRVGSGDGLLGLDLTVDGPLDVVAEVFADENDDPEPGNNVLDLADTD